MPWSAVMHLQWCITSTVTEWTLFHWRPDKGQNFVALTQWVWWSISCAAAAKATLWNDHKWKTINESNVNCHCQCWTCGVWAPVFTMQLWPMVLWPPMSSPLIIWAISTMSEHFNPISDSLISIFHLLNFSLHHCSLPFSIAQHLQPICSFLPQSVCPCLFV